jgi:phosphate transport system permease protein
MKSRWFNWVESAITLVIRISGYSAILFVSLIFIFLLLEGMPTLSKVSFADLISSRWYPIEDYFGLLPLIGGSLVVTLGAALIAVPIGLGTAVFIAEVAPRWAREILKPLWKCWQASHPWCLALSAFWCWRPTCASS